MFAQFYLVVLHFFYLNWVRNLALTYILLAFFIAVALEMQSGFTGDKESP